MDTSSNVIQPLRKLNRVYSSSQLSFCALRAYSIASEAICVLKCLDYYIARIFNMKYTYGHSICRVLCIEAGLRTKEGAKEKLLGNKCESNELKHTER